MFFTALDRKKLRVFIEMKDYHIVREGSDIVNTDKALNEEFYITKSDDGYAVPVV